MSKQTYKAWEPDIASLDDADEFEAGSPSEAAERYAEEDVDGQDEYWGDGVRIHVLCPVGDVHRFKVSASTSMTAWDDETKETNPEREDSELRRSITTEREDGEGGA